MNATTALLSPSTISTTAQAPIHAPLSAAGLVALLPIVALATGVVVVMLVAAFARGHLAVARLTGLVFAITLFTLAYAGLEIPQTVTPLLRIDALALYTIALLSLASLAVTLIAYPYFEARQLHREEFYLLLLLAMLGAAVLAAANHFATLLLGLETLGIALFCLASYGARSRVMGDGCVEAGLKYLVLSGIASALMLFGMALIYAQSGQLGFDAISPPLAAAPEVDIILFYGGSALILAGLCFKLSLVPFHLWTPDVYQGAPAPVSAVIATLSKGAIFVVLVRYVTASDSLRDPRLFGLIAIIAGLSMLVGNWLALMQDNIKRLLAYSSIAHLGYLLVAFLALQGHSLALAVEACSVYLAAYVITTAGAFAIVSLQSSHSEAEMDDIGDYSGLFWRQPLTALAFTLMLLSLAGIPLTAGFIGKFYLFSAGAQAGLWSLLGLLIAGSGIGLFYYLRLITALYKTAATSGAENAGADGEPDGDADNRRAGDFDRDSDDSLDNNVRQNNVCQNNVCQNKARHNNFRHNKATLTPGYAAVAVLALALLVVGVYPQPLAEQAQRIASTLEVVKSHMASK